MVYAGVYPNVHSARVGEVYRKSRKCMAAPIKDDSIYRVLRARGNARLVESSLTVRIGQVMVAQARGGFWAV